MFDLKKFLPNVFLFSSLEDSEISALVAISHTLKFKKSETIFRQGDQADSFYILAYGKAKIAKVSKSGAEQIIHFVDPFGPMAEAAIFDEGNFPGSAVTLEESLVVKIPRNDFFQLLKKTPAISFKMMSSYSKRLRGFVKTIENLTQKDALKRVIHVLMIYAEEGDKKGTLISRFPHPKKELASMYNMTPETFSRNLSHLKKEKLIKENKDKSYTILRELLETNQ